MANEIHKILMVAFLDESRPSAYKIISSLQHYGYATDICHAPPDIQHGVDPEKKAEQQEHEPKDESNLQPDLYLNKATDLSIYDGVIFLDDGGDPKSSKLLAKRADDGHIAVGGYAYGMEILAMAGLLKKKFAPANIPKEWSKGSKLVNSPTVRCDNIVSSAGKCADGFVALFVDALGGKVKRLVEGVGEDAIPLAQAALVISPVAKWSEYWGLSERLAKLGTTLVIADWNDIDVKSKTIKQCLAFGPEVSDSALFIDVPCFIPRNVWLRQAMPSNDLIAAAQSLEEIGCVNVNSAESIRLAADKAVVAKIAGIETQSFDNPCVAADVLLSAGTRWAKADSGVPLKICGFGTTALVPNGASGSAHVLMAKNGLVGRLNSAFGGGPVKVQKDMEKINFAGKLFDIRVLATKSESGWKEVACEARGDACSHPADSFLKIAFPDSWQGRLEAASAKAVEAAKAFSAMAAANELEIAIVFAGTEARVSDIEAVPNFGMDPAGFGRIARMAGIQAEAQACGDCGCHGADHIEATPDEEDHYREIERELGNHGIWKQFDGRFAVSGSEGIDVKSITDLIRSLAFDAKEYVQKFREADPYDKFHARMYGRLAKNSLQKFRLLKELRNMDLMTRKAASLRMVKTADYIFDQSSEEYDYDKGTVPGPFSNVGEPARVLPMKEGDEFMNDMSKIFDEKTIRDMARYHPEGDNEYDLWHQNDPETWEDVEKGNTDYPSRVQLMIP